MENLENLIELEISNQGFSNNGWKLLKKLRNNNNNYYALIECEKCGDTKIVNYYNFINGKQRKCSRCRYYDLIGTTIGTSEIIGVDHIDYITRDSGKKTEFRPYYLVRCTKCGYEHVKAYNKTNWLTYKGCNKCQASFEDPELNKIKRAYKSNAKARGLSWELTDEQFLELVTKDCTYCGHSQKYNGIDRIDSSKGYTINNCVPCCTWCNVMKLNHSESEFLAHIRQIYNFQLEKQGSTTIENTTNEVGSE